MPLCSLRRAGMDDAEPVYELVQETIRAVYPDYYEPAIVDGFCRLHNLDAIASDIGLGKVLVLEFGGRIVGTGTLDGGHITRVFVSPALQGRGLGARLMGALEEEASRSFSTTVVDSSAPAEPFYLHMGYEIIDQGKWHIEATVEHPSATLVYKIMEKSLVLRD